MEKNSNQSNNNSEFYTAIYEFNQGSCPKIVWQNGILKGVKDNDFCLAVVNTPTNFQLSSLNSPPTIISSFFMNIQYIALYIQILDYQARGFTRPIVLVFAYSGDSRNVNIMEYLMCLHRKEFLELAESFQKKANDIFPSELKKYALQLQYIIDHSNSDKIANLRSKFEELKRMLPLAGITDLENESSIQNEIDPNVFIQINNDLRKIEDMIDIKNNTQKVLQFIEKLPKSQLQATVVGGLGVDTDIFIQTFEADHTTDGICLSRLKEKENIIFSLLCGITIVIQVPNNRKSVYDAQQFSKKLSVLSPLDKPQKIEYIPKIDLLSNILENDIVITHDCNQNLKQFPFAILNLENSSESFITPLSCPAGSFVHRLVSSTEAFPINENIFLIAIFNRIKHAYSKFLIKIAEISVRTRQTRERMLAALKSFSFQNDDEPIFKYWIYSMISKASSSPNVKTIILNPMS